VKGNTPLTQKDVQNACCLLGNGMNGRHRIYWLTIFSIVFLVTGMIGSAVFRSLARGAPAVGDISGTIDVGGRTRTYYIHIPPRYSGRTPVPLVLVLHGAAESPAIVEQLTGMSTKADEENFIAAYPRGTGHLNPALMPTWNSGNCCGYAMNNNIDDVGFIRSLINKLEKDYKIDPKRIFVAGISNGGMMSYRLACELSDKIAAAAPVEGAQNLACRPSNPVSIIVFHGTSDHLVPFNGGTTAFQSEPARTDTSVADTVAFWVKRDGCSPISRHEETSELHRDVYTGCKDGVGVELYAVQGGHHVWPGSPMSHNSIPATDLMWNFFSQHPKR
jgi:polyhydroxybutyrate depolymerase